MDPLTAVALASAVVNLIDMGMQITKRIKELSEAGDISPIFSNIRTRLPLIISIVRNTRIGKDHLSPDAEAAFEAVVRQCFEQVNQLDEILKKMVITRKDSRFKKVVKAGISLVEEQRVQRIATALGDNVQLLTFLNVTPRDDVKPQEEKVEKVRSKDPPSYKSLNGQFIVPFSRDKQFVGRASSMDSISMNFKGSQNRVAISGIGGVGKSQVAIEYCYRYRENGRNAPHVFWVYGGTIARFYQGYKTIAQALDIPGWDDPENSILELVRSFLSTTPDSYLLVVDNADNIEHWWPGKYKSGSSLDDPSKNLAQFLPGKSDNGRILITTRDNRVASRLAREGKPVALQPMSAEESRSLFLSKLGEAEGDYDESEIVSLLSELDHLPLAMTQAAAFIEENGISVAEYSEALCGKDASVVEEFLDEELHDSRRDDESLNSVFRTWKLSYDQIRQQKPRAADLLCLLAMFDRQSIPKFLLKMPEVTTCLGVLQSFSLINTRDDSQSFQLHRLVQLFVQISVQRDNSLQKWQEIALACLSKDYPTEIGVAEWVICDSLAPHVHGIVEKAYTSTEARLDLAHLLCWAADFDIERGMYAQALRRAEKSRSIFSEMVPKSDERLVSATWLYGRLRFYQAQSKEDMDMAAALLQEALRTAEYPSLNYGESAFELAHLYYHQSNGEKCLEMGKASFECWETLSGANSVRTLDNMHDYALELAMLGREDDGIAAWQDIVERCSTNTDASENTKTIFIYRSMAGIAEFQGDSTLAEIFYSKLITLSRALYYSEHTHIYDYRLSHAEQVMREGKLPEAIRLSEDILASCKTNSEWRIEVSCWQTIATCHRTRASYSEELPFRFRILQSHVKHLGRDHKETVDAEEALADCYLNDSEYAKAKALYQFVYFWRDNAIGPSDTDTIRALECLGICHAYQEKHADAEATYLDAISRQNTSPEARLLDNLQISLYEQKKWEALETWARRSLDLDDIQHVARARSNLITALQEQSKMEEALETRVAALTTGLSTQKELAQEKRVPTHPPMRLTRRFGRILHPRTWSC